MLANAVIAGGVAALIVAGGASGLIAWAGPVDRPRDRGSHADPTPTAGGLGIMAGSSVGLLVFAMLVQGGLAEISKIACALGFASALGLVGALDDLLDIGAKRKLVVQVALALLFATFVARIEAIPLTASTSLPLGPILGGLGTTLWLLVAVNAVNFMDGANGLAPGCSAIVLLAFALCAFMAGDVVIGGAALIVAMGGIGFLPWNFPKARLFQGDGGALFTSFFLAALAVIGAGSKGSGPVFVYFVPLALTPFLADVLLTLLARALSRKPLLDAHSEHLYQRWLARHGGSHVALTLRTFGVVALFSGAAMGLQQAAPAVKTLGFLIGIAASVLGWRALSRRNPAMER